MRTGINIFLGIMVLLLPILCFYGTDPLLMNLLGYFLSFCCVVTGSIYLYKKRLLKSNVLLLYISAIIFLSITITNWPFKLFFKYYEDNFEIIARKVGKDNLQDFPQVVGTHKIIRSEKRDSITYLWVQGSYADGVAFVKGERDKIGNIWSIVRLSNEWWYVVFD